MHRLRRVGRGNGLRFLRADYGVASGAPMPNKALAVAATVVMLRALRPRSITTTDFVLSVGQDFFGSVDDLRLARRLISDASTDHRPLTKSCRIAPSWCGQALSKSRIQMFAVCRRSRC